MIRVVIVRILCLRLIVAVDHRLPRDQIILLLRVPPHRLNQRKKGDGERRRVRRRSRLRRRAKEKAGGTVHRLNHLIQILVQTLILMIKAAGERRGIVGDVE